MVKKTFKFPESSFLSMEKDMNLIVDMMFKNDSLKKLLYYTSKDCMSKPDLTDDQTVEMFGKQIKIVPKLQVDNELLNYVIVSFDNFTANRTNPEFRDNIIEFDIICHFDQWHLTDFQLRPYRIAAELDTIFNNQRLTSIGTLEFLGASQMILTDEYAGLCLMYSAVHGNEDKKEMTNPADEEQMVNNFNKMFNE
jgi:hypothetical protein